MPRRTKARALVRSSSGVEENFFLLDDCLRSCLAGGVLTLRPALRGILMRTIALGEIQRSSRKEFRGRSVAGKPDTNVLLPLYYSRFFELAPRLVPPPGPRPLFSQEADRDFPFRFGLLLHPREDQELLWKTARRLGLPESFFRKFISFQSGEFLGLQRSGSGLRLSLYARGDADFSLEALAGESDDFHEEVYLRQGSRGFYLRPGRDEAPGAARGKKRVFTQHGLRDMNSSILFLRARCPRT